MKKIIILIICLILSSSVLQAGGLQRGDACSAAYQCASRKCVKADASNNPRGYNYVCA